MTKIELSSNETAYIADRILEDLRGFTDMDGNTDEHSRPELIGIIENAIDDLNEDRITNNPVASRNGRTKTEHCTQTNGGENNDV